MTFTDVTDTTALAPPYPQYMQPNQTAAVIAARIMGRVAGTQVDLSEGSWEMDWIQLCAQELSLVPDALWRALKSSFMLYPECAGILVDFRAAEENVDRGMAAYATVTLQFTAPTGTTFTAGWRVSTTATPTGSPSVIFTTVATVTVPAASTNVSVVAVCQTAGPSGNVSAGTLTNLIDTIPGVVVSVTNLAAASGGVATEADPSVKSRYFTAVRNRGTSGDPAQWRGWAMSVAGVGNAAVVRTPAGPGSVGVSLLGTDGNPASAGVVTAVTNYLLGTGSSPGVAPIGPTDVRVYAAPTLVLSISAVVTYDAGAVIASVKSAMQSGWQNLFKSLAFNPIDNSVYPDQVGAVITATPGVAYYDISTLRVGGQTSVISVPPDTIPVVGAVSV